MVFASVVCSSLWDLLSVWGAVGRSGSNKRTAIGQQRTCMLQRRAGAVSSIPAHMAFQAAVMRLVCSLEFVQAEERLVHCSLMCILLACQYCVLACWAALCLGRCGQAWKQKEDGIGRQQQTCMLQQCAGAAVGFFRYSTHGLLSCCDAAVLFLGT